MDDKMVEWLFRNPLSDGGTFTGVADIVSKYGLVPKDVMPETNSSENTCLLYTSTGVFAGTEQVDDKYSGGFPLRQEAEYGVAQFFAGKLDVGFG